MCSYSVCSLYLHDTPVYDIHFYPRYINKILLYSFLRLFYLGHTILCNLSWVTVTSTKFPHVFISRYMSSSIPQWPFYLGDTIYVTYTSTRFTSVVISRYMSSSIPQWPFHLGDTIYVTDISTLFNDVFLF